MFKFSVVKDSSDRFQALRMLGLKSEVLFLTFFLVDNASHHTNCSHPFSVRWSRMVLACRAVRAHMSPSLNVEQSRPQKSSLWSFSEKRTKAVSRKQRWPGTEHSALQVEERGAPSFFLKKGFLTKPKMLPETDLRERTRKQGQGRISSRIPLCPSALPLPRRFRSQGVPYKRLRHVPVTLYCVPRQSSSPAK